MQLDNLDNQAKPDEALARINTLASQSAGSFDCLRKVVGAIRGYVDAVSGELWCRAVEDSGTIDAVEIPDEAVVRGLYKQMLTDEFLTYTESTTRDRFIDPVLLSLGWKLGKRKYARREVRIDYDRVADYLLYNSQGAIFAVVEAKKLQEPLDQYEGQLFAYMKAAFSGTGILTNGFEWRIYRVIDGNENKQSLSVDLLSKDTDIVTHHLLELHRMTSHQNNYITSRPKPRPKKIPSPLDDGWVENL